jgi:PAS domain S-box-containing protein
MKNLRVRSLKARMTLSTLAIFLACMWLLSFYACTMLQRDMERISGQQQFSTVSMAADDVNREIEDRANALKVTAALVTSSMMDSPPVLQKYLEDRPVFQALFNSGIFVAGADGIAIASLPISAQRLGISYLDRDYFKAALKDGSTVVGDPVIGKKSKNPIFVMATPISNAQGKIIGALMGVTNLGIPNFLNYVTNVGYGKSGGFLIVARKPRQIVTATDKSRIMETLADTPIVRRYLDGYEGSGVFVNSLGVTVLSSVKAIPAANWYLVASLPSAEAFEPIADLRQRMFWATIMLSVFACGFTWWLLRHQLFPVLATVEKLAIMADESVPLQPLPVPEHTEVGGLINGVNRVLKTLEQRESALVESEAFRSAIIDSVFAEIAVLDRHGVITAVNKPWQRFFGVFEFGPDASLPGIDIGTNYKHFCRAGIIADEDIASRVFHGIEAVLEQRLPVFTMEYCCDATGQARWFKLIVTPLELASGGAVVAHTNITESKHSDELRRLSEERLAMMQLGSNDGFWDWDLINNHLFYSERWWSMLGYTDGELAGDPALWRKLMHPDDTERVNQFFAGVLVDDRISYNVEFRLQHKDGHYVPIDSRGFIQRDQDGKAFRASGSNLDLTERKRAEAELLTAKAEAEAANQAKSHFLAAVSHDLRQPLAALSLYADLLTVDAPGNKAIMPRLKDCVSTLGEMLSDLLDVSKLDTGAIVPVPGLFEMDDVIDTLVSVHAAKAAHKGLHLRVHPSCLVVRTDRALMLRIIGNLIANAVEYTNSGGVLIASRCHAGKQWLEVYDTGIGIAEDKIDLIFEVFKQVNNEARNAGSGLGLYIVAKTSELLGLQIRVKSRVGHGSLFAIELPVDNASVVNPSVPFFCQEAKRRIAFVEDNVMVMQAMSLALEQLGHEVVAAASCKQMIARLHGQAPDLIISDYRLTDGETGYDVIRTLRARFDASLPAIIITGDTDKNYLSGMLEQNIVMMYKPVSIDALHANILRMTGKDGMPAVASLYPMDA